MSASNAGDPGSIPGSGRSPGEGNGNPLQYSCLENPLDRGAWQATVHGVAKSRTRLSNFTLSHIVFGGSVVKDPPANAGDTGDVSSPKLGRFPGGRNGNPLQYFCLGIPLDRGAWQATVHGVAKSQTRLSMHACINPYMVSAETRR